MSRSALFLAVALALAPARAAFADDKPTPEQIEQAKKAFQDGKALHDQGKLKEAAEKFRESYKLSKNPVLLYNVGFTLDELKDKQHALVFYRKFLNEAPKDDGRRDEVTERVKQLEKEIEEEALGGGTPEPPVTNPPVTNPPVTNPPVDNTQVKPAGTYKAEDFQHQVVLEAPPNKPLDLSASIPKDSGWQVTLYFRKAGEAAFTAKSMKWRYQELVARIPAATMTGSAIQYYIEVKDQTGTVVTRSGKSPSPNLVDIEVSAPQRFYPDLVDDGGTGKPNTGKPRGAENPLQPNGGNTGTETPETPMTPGGGFTDVGSQKFKYTKWGATGAAGAFFATSIIFYLQAGKQADALATDSKTDPTTGMPCNAPCRPFDSFDAGLESAGKRDQTISRVTLGLGVVSTGVAAYFWWKEHKGGGKKAWKSGSEPSGPVHDEMSWIVVPTVGDGFAGATAAARF